LSLRKHCGKPIRQQAELTYKEWEVFGGYDFEIAHGSKLRHPRGALNGDLEIFIFVKVVGECSDSAKGMRFDDDVDELELCGQSVEAVRPTRIVPDDPHIVVANMALFEIEMRVVRM